MIKNFLRLPAKTQAFSLSKQARAGFCIYSTYLDPRQHITMSHNPQNVYEDIVMMGDYLQPVKPMTKITSRKYLPDLLQISFDYLNQQYPNANLRADSYEDIRLYSWGKFGVDFNQHKAEILERLATGIFVTEHKLRWPIEQRLRLSYTSSLFSYLDMQEYRIEFFYDAYLSWLSLHVDRSHLFRSPKIAGDTSFLERYLEDNSSQPTGLEVLKRNIPANKTFINRFLNYVHS